MKHLTIALLFFYSLLTIAKSQTITDVVAEQDGNKVIIKYNLNSESEADISLYVSEEGGKVFKGPMKSVSGDAGRNIKPGSKTIIWNTLNDQDIITGDNIVFRILGNSTFGKFTDNRDGKTYKTVLIGNQTWMAENLNYASRNSWCYDKISSNCAKYGRLYDWETAKESCPNGWHLPSDTEWTILTTFLSGESVAGGKLKETGTTHWQSPNTDADNSSFFNALPGGYRYGVGAYSNIGNNGNWWSSTENGTGNAWRRNMNYNNSILNRNNNGKLYGFSVRCLRDL